MKKITIILALFIFSITGCNTDGSLPNESSTPLLQESTYIGSSVESTDITSGESVVATELKAEITRLENGLPAVKYEGDCGFEEFLANGGASSDEDVIKYLSVPTTITSESDTSAVDSASADTVSSDTPEESSEEKITDNEETSQPLTDKEENDLSIAVTVNGHEFSATLYDTETARAFKERLPLSLDMSELNGNEKYYYLPEGLPVNSSRPPMINAGDLMLFGSDCLVLFYESFSTPYSYTPIGKIADPDESAEALGSGSVRVYFS